MIDTPAYALTDEDRLRALVREHGWATLISPTPDGVIASHLPVVLEDGDELAVVGHLGRPDDEQHELDSGREVLLVVQGPHGYVSPGWYGYGPAVPTWNYVAAHLYGTLERLSPQATLQVLADTVDRYEHVMPAPVRMADVAEYAHRIAHGTAGFRLRVTRWQGKAKLSQDKPPEVRRRVEQALREDPHYAVPALADAVLDEMARDEMTRDELARSAADEGDAR